MKKTNEKRMVLCLRAASTDEVVMFLKEPGGPIIKGSNFEDAKHKFVNAMNYYNVISEFIFQTELAPKKKSDNLHISSTFNNAKTYEFCQS